MKNVNSFATHPSCVKAVLYVIALIIKYSRILCFPLKYQGEPILSSTNDITGQCLFAFETENNKVSPILTYSGHKAEVLLLTSEDLISLHDI